MYMYKNVASVIKHTIPPRQRPTFGEPLFEGEDGGFDSVLAVAHLLDGGYRRRPHHFLLLGLLRQLLPYKE